MHSLLKGYIPTANMIARTFGQNCEVVLHDLTHPVSSVVYVVNGHITGRSVGQSFDHLVKNVLLSKNFRDDYVVNYEFITATDRKIKSSSSLIRDESEKVVGMLCINYDVSFLNELHRQLLDFLPYLPEQISEQEPGSDSNVTDEIMVIIDQLIDDIIGDADVHSYKKKDILELIEFMNKKGVFLVKGAIDKVADRLDLSKVTIYSYLNEVKKMQSQTI
ncbi:MAG: helix-turn-helix transcriptional regulator [Sporomusaceae bacterium]|nr:helix-turn-helix transcriptional regulator [Sporomusaceae bacterium]